MKLVAVNASFRGRRGKTAHFLDLMLAGAASSGAQIDRIDLADLELKHCLDCQRCQKPTFLASCVLKDDAASVFDRMRQADLLLFGTPVYTLGMSSLLKTLFERYYFTANVRSFELTKSGLFFHNVDPALCRKPFVSLVVCDNLMDETVKNARQYFHLYGQFMDAPHVGDLFRKSASLSESDGQSPVEKAYFQAGTELALRGRISRATQKAANSSLVLLPPFVQWSWVRRLLAKSRSARAKIEARHRTVMDAAVNR